VSQEPSEERIILRFGVRELSFVLTMVGGEWQIQSLAPSGSVAPVSRVLVGEVVDGATALAAHLGAVEIVCTAFGRTVAHRLFPSPCGGEAPLLLVRGRLLPWREASIQDLLPR